LLCKGRTGSRGADAVKTFLGEPFHATAESSMAFYMKTNFLKLIIMEVTDYVSNKSHFQNL
jgi:hypothetical protein